jgi:hypothetical protein
VTNTNPKLFSNEVAVKEIALSSDGSFWKAAVENTLKTVSCDFEKDPQQYTLTEFDNEG